MYSTDCCCAVTVMGCKVIGVFIDLCLTADHSNIDGLSRLPLKCVAAVKYNTKHSLCNINHLSVIAV